MARVNSFKDGDEAAMQRKNRAYTKWAENVDARIEQRYGKQKEQKVSAEMKKNADLFESKMNEAVIAMKKTPGTYYITNAAGRALGYYMAVEVDADGKVYQLNPAMQRDGELDDDGWNPNAEVLTEPFKGGKSV